MDVSSVSGKRKCWVRGCETTGGRMFQFPHVKGSESRYEKWILASGNETLYNIKQDQIRSRTICIKHFEQKYILNRKLTTSAVPTLHLPDSNVTNQESLLDKKLSDEKEIFGEETCVQDEVFAEDEICVKREFQEKDETCANTEPLMKNEKYMEKEKEMSFVSPLQSEVLDAGCNKTKENFEEQQEIKKEYVGEHTVQEKNCMEEKMGEHRTMPLERNDATEPRKSQIRRDIVPILKLIGVTSRKDLSQREEKLYSIIISMTKSMQQLRKSRDLLKQRLAFAETLLTQKDEKS